MSVAIKFCTVMPSATPHPTKNQEEAVLRKFQLRIGIFSATVQAIAMKFCTMTHVATLHDIKSFKK